MSKVFIEESTLSAIGNSIRAKTGKTDMIPPLQMPIEIASIKGGGDAIIKTVEGTLPLTVEGVGQRLEDYKIYGAYGGSVSYGPNNEYVGYDYITTKQGPTANKSGFNSGIKWNEVNRFRFGIRNNSTSTNNMIFAAKPKKENVCAALATPWISLQQAKYENSGLSNLSSASFPTPGAFGIDTLTFTTPISSNYIWVGSWMDGAWSRDNDWTFVEFYKDDTLVAAFHPAKRVSDGVFGFYNTVSGAFITCNASTSGFVGNAELTTSVGDLDGSYYLIPVKVNDVITTIQSPSQLGADDYIDFENRVVVKNGVASYVNLPEIYLANGTNIIDVDTTLKPSRMEIRYVNAV